MLSRLCLRYSYVLKRKEPIPDMTNYKPLKYIMSPGYLKSSTPSTEMGFPDHEHTFNPFTRAALYEIENYEFTFPGQHYLLMSPLSNAYFIFFLYSVYLGLDESENVKHHRISPATTKAFSQFKGMQRAGYLDL